MNNDKNEEKISDNEECSYCDVDDNHTCKEECVLYLFKKCLYLSTLLTETKNKMHTLDENGKIVKRIVELINQDR